MTTTYQVADMMIGVRNMIEAADLRRGDQVLLLADTRSERRLSKRSLPVCVFLAPSR